MHHSETNDQVLPGFESLGLPHDCLGTFDCHPDIISQKLCDQKQRKVQIWTDCPRKKQAVYFRVWAGSGFFFPLLLSLSCRLSVDPPFLGLALMHMWIIKDEHLRHGCGRYSPPDNCWYIHSPESVIFLVFLLSNPCLLPSSPVCLLTTESPLPSLGSSLPIYYPSYAFYFQSNK